MTTYRAGQRVRIEWPDGSAVEGTVLDRRGFGYATIAVGSDEFPTWYELEWPGNDGRTVTVLSEPRPDEPKGLGAVVEAEYKDHGRQKWVSNRGKGESHSRWTSIPYWGFLDWDLLADPVVLSDGWTP